MMDKIWFAIMLFLAGCAENVQFYHQGTLFLSVTSACIAVPVGVGDVQIQCIDGTDLDVTNASVVNFCTFPNSKFPQTGIKKDGAVSAAYLVDGLVMFSRVFPGHYEYADCSFDVN